MPEPFSRLKLKSERYRNESDGPGGISETHLLLSRPIIVSQIERTQSTTTGSLQAGVTAGAGHTKKSTETIPRHAQRLFLQPSARSVSATARNNPHIPSGGSMEQAHERRPNR
jgi:hypothetical protein